GPAASHEPIYDEVCELAQELVDQRAIRRGAGRWLRCRSRPTRLKGLRLLTQSEPLCGDVRLHRRDLLCRSRPGPGVFHHRRGCLFPYERKILAAADGTLPFVRFRPGETIRSPIWDAELTSTR